LPFFQFNEKRVNFVLLSGKGREKKGEKNEENFNVFFHNEKFGYKSKEIFTSDLKIANK
jgi:hypothetical protein